MTPARLFCRIAFAAFLALLFAFCGCTDTLTERECQDRVDDVRIERVADQVRAQLEIVSCYRDLTDVLVRCLRDTDGGTP